VFKQQQVVIHALKSCCMLTNATAILRQYRQTGGCASGCRRRTNAAAKERDSPESTTRGRRHREGMHQWIMALFRRYVVANASKR